MRAILWRRLDLPSLELCWLGQLESAPGLRGEVLTTAGGAPREVTYEIVCHPDWSTHSVRVRSRRDEQIATLTLRRELSGVWIMNDSAELAGFSDAVDVDLGFTPSTNTLPINRLRLRIGARADVTALWVKFPELSIHTLQQSYTRLAKDRYLYESAGGSFRADLIVDELGLVLNYENLFGTVVSFGAVQPASE